MLIGPHALKTVFDVSPNGVLHVGAHEAEEEPAYRELGWGPVIWVEMLPGKAESLRSQFAGDPRNTVIEAAGWSVSGCTRDLFEASNAQSSSLFAPLTHLTAHPDISFVRRTIETRRLDEVIDPSHPLDFLNMDCQGAEVEVMHGLGSLLGRFRWCYLEINTDPLYDGIPLRSDVDRFMVANGFTRVVEAIHAHLGWGDALYVNRQRFHPRQILEWKLRGADWQRQRDSLALAGDALLDTLRDRSLRAVA